MITGRSIGTFVNPNNLGFFAVISFWSAVHVFRGTPRIAAAFAALATLAVSQSRGSLLALLVSVAVWLVYLALSKDKTLRPAFDIAFALVMASIAGLLLALAFLDPGRLSSRMGQRLASGIAVVTGGVAMDPSAQGRVGAWLRALEFYERHPLGTLGEPQFLFGGFIDNEFVRILLQGGPVFLIATILALGAGIRLIECGPLGRMIATFSAAAAVNAMTANPLSYPAIGLYWMVVGYYLASRKE